METRLSDRTDGDLQKAFIRTSYVQSRGTSRGLTRQEESRVLRKGWLKWIRRFFENLGGTPLQIPYLLMESEIIRKKKIVRATASLERLFRVAWSVGGESFLNPR
jgi:hypothetical protein